MGGLNKFRFRDHVANMIRKEYFPDTHTSTLHGFCMEYENGFGNVIQRLAYDLCCDIAVMIDVFQFILSRTCALGSYINLSVHSMRFNNINRIYDFVCKRSITYPVLGLGYNEFLFIIFFNFTSNTTHGYTANYDRLFQYFIIDYYDSYGNTSNDI